MAILESILKAILQPITKNIIIDGSIPTSSNVVDGADNIVDGADNVITTG